MGVICRLLFVILFIPGCFIGMAFDLVMYIAIGDKHEPYKVKDSRLLVVNLRGVLKRLPALIAGIEYSILNN